MTFDSRIGLFVCRIEISLNEIGSLVLGYIVGLE